MSEDRHAPTATRSRRRLLAGVGVAAVVALVVGLVVFQPWKLVVDEVVEEALPAATAPASAAPASTAPSTSAPGAASAPPSRSASGTASPSPASTARVIARGELVSHEHATTGTVVVLALPDGRRVLRLQDLRTSNGPDVKVWLSDAPVLRGSDGWRVFDDGAYADLGSLKGNVGNQNYAIPASVDLAALPSLSLWCDRFDVSFGAATLTPV
jgi:hypothetical protein